jgi:phospholipid/cholesterol/gamma-HCH transport system ATP-binding protein
VDVDERAVFAEDFRIACDGVCLTLGGRSIFRDLTCGFLRGQISIVLGGSGVGKSTLLRLIGGLTRPDSGAVRVADRDVTRLPERDLFRVRQRIGMLFQGGALLDSMTIFDNVALPLREHTELSEEDIAAEVSRRLEAVGLPETEDLFPRHLSGGMNRRAALARAVIADPEILLCDEPFSGLDPVNVRRIEELLVDLNRRLGLTILVTSHHLASTLRMADRIVFLLEGRAVSGSPRELLQSVEAPIAEFMAAENSGAVERPETSDGPASMPSTGGAT